MQDSKDWGNEREGKYFSRKLSHRWRYACNETQRGYESRHKFFSGKWPCLPGNNSVVHKTRMQGWKQHGPTFEARSKATILLYRQFRIVLVYAHTQSLAKKYGENLVPCRALSAKWPPRRILGCQALSEDMCVKTGTCAIAHGARKIFAQEDKI